MLLLTSTSDLVQAVVGATGASVTVHASWVDNASGTITPGRTNTAAITTASTVTIVGSPGASTQRNVRGIVATNNSATDSTQVTIRHTDGTNVADLFSVNLLPGENLVLSEEGEWAHHDANGAEYFPVSPINPLNVYGIDGTRAESIPRMLVNEANLSALTSGTLHMVAVYLQAGQRINAISFCSATTAANTPTNRFFALYDINRNLLAQTNNATTTAWAANTVSTLSLTSQYVVPTTGLYYVGIMVTATGVPTLKGLAAKTGGQLAGRAPILHGNSTTGNTTSLPNPAGAITATVNAVWCALT
jgi:hypothetical protein